MTATPCFTTPLSSVRVHGGGHFRKAILIYESGPAPRVKLFQASLMLPNLFSWVGYRLYRVYAYLNDDTAL
jgi:hypothetical protein